MQDVRFFTDCSSLLCSKLMVSPFSPAMWEAWPCGKQRRWQDAGDTCWRGLVAEHGGLGFFLCV